MPNAIHAMAVKCSKKALMDAHVRIGAGFWRERLAVCSGCGIVFVPPGRKPTFGKRRYCKDCGRAAALRDAKTDYRARQRAKKVIEADGHRS